MAGAGRTMPLAAACSLNRAVATTRSPISKVIESVPMRMAMLNLPWLGGSEIRDKQSANDPRFQQTEPDASRRHNPTELRIPDLGGRLSLVRVAVAVQSELSPA
jgi:hypothetical protein